MIKISPEELNRLESIANELRAEAIKMVGHAGTGHIGGSLSCCEILTALYFNVLNVDIENPKWEDRDRFVMSKGHATPMIYSALAKRGFFPMDWLKTFDVPLSNLPKHIDMHVTPGIDMSTGALGQGLSVGVGMACAAKLSKKEHRVYVVLGDGEMASGQNWEAGMSAVKFKLDNLTAFIDRNKLQVDGATDTGERIMPLYSLVEKWRSFGWHTIEVDGHSLKELLEAIDTAQNIKDKPTMIISHTIKGKGVSFMENNVAWHHNAIDEENVKKALAEIEQAAIQA